MKEQISTRLGVAHVRDTMMQFITGTITRQQAMESLQIGKSRLYELRTSYLKAKAEGKDGTSRRGHDDLREQCDRGELRAFRKRKGRREVTAVLSGCPHFVKRQR